MKKWAVLLIAALLGAVVSTPVHAAVPSVIDPTAQPDENIPLIITSVYTAKNAGFVELHNQGASPVNLGRWVIRYASADSEVDIHLPDGWLLTDNFVVLSENGLVAGTLSFPQLAFAPAETIQTVELIDDTGVSVSRLSNLPADITTKWYQRKSTGMSGVFTNDFSAATASTKLRHTPPYQAPANHTAMRIVEIYPHASSCAPNDTSTTCGDYVKLFNPTAQIQDIGNYQLRSDSGSSLSSNAFHLDSYQSVPAGGYVTVRLRDDGSPMSLTDDGGYVWLEDAEGVERYDETIVQYPSASSTTKIGWAWALADNGEWLWTPTPAPDTTNTFPVPGQGGGLNEAVSLNPCPAGKYRNPDTNRCRTIEEAINALTACDEGSERNPETNRCRKVASLASATITPCGVGQERNPDTNRCHKIAGVSTTALAPCKAGQERNAETNRCRNVASSAKSAAAINQPEKQGINAVGGVALGVVGAVAVGYGVFEWRNEITVAFGRLLAALGKK